MNQAKLDLLSSFALAHLNFSFPIHWHTHAPPIQCPVLSKDHCADLLFGFTTVHMHFQDIDYDPD